MMLLLRSFAALLLALMLAGTGGAVASARGAMASLTELVICTGHGAEVIVLDRDGNPAEPVAVCPDCAFGTFPTLLEPTTRHILLPATVALVVLADDVSFPEQGLHRSRARGPPLSA